MNNEQQIGLFEADHSVVGALFDNLDHLPENEIVHKWPSTLVELIDVMRSELVRQGENSIEAQNKASKLVGVMAHYFGGQSFYLPTGNTLKDALRNVMIFRDFNGGNVPTLVRKYKLSESHIYAIIREQRALQRRRHQPEFKFD
ncbi:transcriptional regulator [[Haemophilus] felis]|uniref:Transcriptional regulator n=1 Tax=[Haemophilus] felis TaxID=123822 RepID=A0A1T0B6Z9_9PAST|nr:transcriptional regulator [[Haemophilus] felis]OOS05864.1 transcriptional regulator [[Haemophilus] felis]